MTRIKALYTLSNNVDILISKGKEYELFKNTLGLFYIYDDTGSQFVLSDGEVKYRFVYC